MTTPTVISSADDLLERCRTANKHKISASASHASQNTEILGLPVPAEANNSLLDKLKPIYQELLSSISTVKPTKTKNSKSKGGKKKSTASRGSLLDHSPYLEPLKLAAEHPDGAIVFLYALEYPELVRSVRTDTFGVGGNKVDETFQLSVISREIALDETLGTWCRQALATAEEYHFLILGSCTDLLHSMVESGNKKLIRKIVLQGARNVDDGLERITADLCRAVQRTPTGDACLWYCIQLQVRLASKFYGEDGTPEYLGVTMKKSHRKVFLDALAQLQQSGVIDETMSMNFSLFFDASRLLTKSEAKTSIEKLKAEVKTPGEAGLVCEAKGCTNPGRYTCARCRSVRYCCEQCQKTDWKIGGHKTSCAGSGGSKKKKPTPAQTSASRIKSPALLFQDGRIAGSPQGVDYVLILPSGQQDMGVSFSGNPMGKMMFHTFRKKAGDGSKLAVYKMYEFLVGQCSQYSDLIRKQLHAEYGVDPFSPEARNGPELDITEEDIAEAAAAM